MIDFRSDTVTRPTPEMLDAMMSAEVGDDVFGDDPTVNRLEQKAAKLFGMEAALFCPSGTMTNQIAIRVHTQQGDDVICDELAHIYQYEGGGIASNSGCSVRLLKGEKGRFTVDMVREAIQPDDPHFPHSRLVCAENTCNKGGGVVWNYEELSAISKFCKENNLAFHLDGARLFNALVKTGRSAAEYGGIFDSVSICLSKGLGCPVGSLLLGEKAFIHKARRVRKVFGGGMRQAGVLAAAGIYALDHNIDRLGQDHANATNLAQHLSTLKWVSEVADPETNIVVAEIANGFTQAQILEKLQQHNIFAVGFGKGKIRFVTHLDISAEMLEQAKTALDRIV